MKKKIKYFLVMLLFFVLVGTSCVNAAEFAPTDSNIAETTNEELIYIIGTHLFTEETDYISAQLMMYAARTIELPKGVEMEDALEYMKIYARDWEGNWTDAITGKPVTFEKGFKFDIKYTDLEKYVVTYANVTNVTEMEEALANPDIKTINIMNDITTDHSIVIGKPVTINGNGNKIAKNGTPAFVSGGDNFVLKVYGAEAIDVKLNNVKLTNAMGAMIVGDNATVTVDGLDVSGNVWGGIEVKDVATAKLVVTSITHDNEAYEVPTVWVDNATVENARISFEGATALEMKNQVQYYKESPVANVGTLAELEEALANAKKAIINLTANITSEGSIEVGRSVTINGAGYEISKNGTPVYVQGGDNYVLKIYGNEAIDVKLNNVKLTNAMGAMIVGDNATVTADGLDVSGNVWGGIEVKDVATAKLVVTSITHDNEAYEVPTVWVDNATLENATIDFAGASYIEMKNQVHYYKESPIANVGTLAELETALANAKKAIINVTANITTEHSIEVGRTVTINGAGFAIVKSGTPSFVSGGDNYVLKVYGAEAIDVKLNNVKLTNAMGAMIVGDNATVTVDGLDVSGNVWGGIEVKDVATAHLVVTSITHDNEKYEVPTVWVDSETVMNAGITFDEATQVAMKEQVHYYKESPVADVASLDELKVALANEKKAIINLTSSIVTEQSIDVGRSVVINGNTNVISKAGTPAFVPGGDNFVLKVYGGAEAIDVKINDVILTNAMGAMIVGDNTTVTVNGLDVTGNVWGGIEVKDVVTAKLVVTSITHDNEKYEVPTVWVDNATLENATIEFAGATAIEMKNQVQYYKVSPVANVGTIDELKAALADVNKEVINLTANITTENSIEVGRTVRINGAGFEIAKSGTPAYVENGDNYVLKVYGTEAIDVKLNNIKLTNAMAAMIVGDNATVTVDGLDVSGNVWGGIEVKDVATAHLEVTSITHDNEAYKVPTVWVDSETIMNAWVDFGAATPIGVDDQVHYYKESPVAEVGTLDELKAALANEKKAIININDYITTAKSIEIGRSVAINGNNYVITKEGTPEYVQGGDNYIFKVYGNEAIDVDIVNIGLTNAMAAMIVGDNARVLVDGLDVSGNVWGGIEVKNVATAELEVGGENNGIIHSNETYGVPTVWVDQTTVANQVATVTLVGATKIETKGQVHYYQQEGVANGNSEEAIKAALADENVTTIIIPTAVEVDEPIVVDREIVLQGEGVITLSDNATDSEAEVLSVTEEGTIIIPAGSKILVERLENSGEIIIGYTPAIYAMRSLAEPTVVDAMLSVIEPITMTETGKITNNGTLLVKDNGSISGTGSITNNGIIRLVGYRTFGTHIGVAVDGEGTVEQWVATEAQLQSAIADVMVDTVALDGDIALTKTMTVERDLTIELNGKTVNATSVDNYYSFVVTAGKLIINGEGTIASDASTEIRNVRNQGATLEINNVTLSGHYNVDTGTKGDRAVTTIKDSTLNARSMCVVGFTNSEINVIGSELTAKHLAVSGNGTGCDVVFNITDSELNSTDAVAVYMPSTESMTITDSTITGYSGIEAVAGTINVVNSTISATGTTYKDVATLDAKTGDGTHDEGSAIFLRSQEGYANEGTLRLTIDDKTTLTSANGNGIRVYENVNKTENTQGVSEILVGYYPKNITAGKDALKVEAKDLITYVEVDDLSVEGEKYVFTEAGLQSAIADENVKTVILGADIALTEATVGGIEVAREVTLEMNGYTIDSTNAATAEFGKTETVAGYQKSYAFVVKKGGEFTINGEGTFTTDKDAKHKNNLQNEAGILNVNNVTFIGNYNIDTNSRSSTEEATTTITGCTLTSATACTTGWSYANVIIDSSELTSTWYAVTGNGTAQSATLNVRNESVLTSEKGVAIYMPSTKELTITDSTVTGYTAIEAVAGEISIENSNLSATGAYKDLAALEAKTGDGTYGEGSAIFLRSHGGYADGSTLKLTIDDKSTLTSANSHGVRVYEHVGKTEADQGVNTITVNYYSDKVSSTKDALMVEDEENMITTVETTDLAE